MTVVCVALCYIQAELGRVKIQLSAKEEELRRTKQQAESDKEVAQEECRAKQSEIGKLKKEVQSLTETQQKLETKNKVSVHHSMATSMNVIDFIAHDYFLGTSRSSKTP